MWIRTGSFWAVKALQPNNNKFFCINEIIPFKRNKLRNRRDKIRNNWKRATFRLIKAYDVCLVCIIFCFCSKGYSLATQIGHWIRLWVPRPWQYGWKPKVYAICRISLNAYLLWINQFVFIQLKLFNSWSLGRCLVWKA